MVTTLDELEEHFWQMFVAFSTGNRDDVREVFRGHIEAVVNIIRDPAQIVAQADIATPAPVQDITAVIDPDVPIIDLTPTEVPQ